MLDPHLSEGLLSVTCFTHVRSNGWLLYWTHSTCVSLVVFRLHSDYNIFSGLLWINPTAQIYPVFQDKSVLNSKQQLNSISLYICSRDFLFPILFFNFPLFTGKVHNPNPHPQHTMWTHCSLTSLTVVNMVPITYRTHAHVSFVDFSPAFNTSSRTPASTSEPETCPLGHRSVNWPPTKSLSPLCTQKYSLITLF